MSGSLRVALCELDTAWEDAALNRERIDALLDGAEREQAHMAVLPELAFSGFTMTPPADDRAEPFLREQARRRKLALVAGLVGNRGEQPTNDALAVGADGAVLARYSKLHPFSFAGEHEHYRAGDSLPLFELAGFRAAMLVCYDLRFPEVFREAALQGANLFFVIANWPEKRVDHWRTLLSARAIENQAYVVAVNRVGSDPHEAYAGASRVVDPLGEVLLEGPGTAELDPGRPAWLRERFPALRDVRTDRYRLVP